MVALSVHRPASVKACSLNGTVMFRPEPPAMTQWGQARFDASKPSFGSRSVPIAETNDPVYDCLPPGTPRIYLHPFPMEIIQTPGRVLMVFEYDHL